MGFGRLNRSLSLAIIAIVILAASNAYLLLRDVAPTPKTTSAPASLQKFKASGYWATIEGYFLVVDAARERGIWASNGLEPEFVTILGRRTLAADLKGEVESGIKIGISTSSEILIARSQGVPVKIVAGYVGLGSIHLFVKGDGPIKTVKDLDGRKIGIDSANTAVGRWAAYMSNKFAIKPEFVPLGNLTNQVVGLKLGKVDAFVSGEGAPLRLVDSGELRIVVRAGDVYPAPWVAYVVFATDELIQQNPDLVKRFVRATLETIQYLKDNPSYAADLYIKKANAPKDLADRAVAQLTWAPSGHGSGKELLPAVSNVWQYNKETGALPANVNIDIQHAVDVRFLP